MIYYKKWSVPMETLDKHVGETSQEVMAHTVCNPETRVLQKVTVEDIVEMEKSFETWMATKVDERKEYIVNNLHRYLIEPPIEEITESKDISKTKEKVPIILILIFLLKINL